MERRYERRLAGIALVASALLAGWMLALALAPALVDAGRSGIWGWLLLDGAELACFIGIAGTALTRRGRIDLWASLGAILICADAIVDTATAGSGIGEAAALALLIELPLSISLTALAQSVRALRTAPVLAQHDALKARGINQRRARPCASIAFFGGPVDLHEQNGKGLAVSLIPVGNDLLERDATGLAFVPKSICAVGGDLELAGDAAIGVGNTGRVPLAKQRRRLAVQSGGIQPGDVHQLPNAGRTARLQDAQQDVCALVEHAAGAPTASW